MLMYQGQLVNIDRQKIRTKTGLEFETTTLQLLDESHRGTAKLVNIYVSRDKVDRIASFKVGAKVALPVSLESSYSSRTGKVYIKYWLAN